jgi:hypothetical protein
MNELAQPAGVGTRPKTGSRSDTLQLVPANGAR